VVTGSRVVPPVLERLLPDVEPGDDPWAALLWATGRLELPGRPRRTDWGWTNSPATITGCGT